MACVARWRLMMHSAISARNASFASGRPRAGKCMLLLSKPKCSSGKCFSSSSIGRKIKRGRLQGMKQARIERPVSLKPQQVGVREKWCLEWADECSSVHGIQVNDGGRRTLAGAIASALQLASLTLAQLANGGVTSTLFLPGSVPHVA